MAETRQKSGQLYRNQQGIVVQVMDYDREGQRVIYRRNGCELEWASPLIIFRATFTRVETRAKQ